MILIAAGCAQHEQQQAKFDETLWTPGYTGSAVAGSSVASQTSGTISDSAQPSAAYSIITPTNANINVEDGVLARDVQHSLAGDPALVTLLPAIQITATNGTVSLAAV